MIIQVPHRFLMVKFGYSEIDNVVDMNDPKLNGPSREITFISSIQFGNFLL